MYTRNFIIEIGSHDYGKWDIPRSSICKLNNQGSQGKQFSIRMKAWAPGKATDLSLESKVLRIRNSEIQGQEMTVIPAQEERNSSIQTLKELDDTLPY
jgi:hypothetical protein